MNTKIIFLWLATGLLTWSGLSAQDCKLVLDENFNHYNDGYKNYTIDMASSDFNGLDVRSAGEVRGLDGNGKSWPADNRVGNGVLRANFPANKAGGPNCGFLFDKRIPDTEEAVLEYKVKFEGAGSNDEFVWAAGGKLPGLGGSSMEKGIPVGCTKNQTSIDNGFSARLMWRRRGELVVYTYFPDRTSNCGVDYKFYTAKPNEWITIRQHIKLNSPGQENGLLEMFVNGKLVFRKTDVLYRIAGKSSVKINDVLFHTYRGGEPDDTRFHSPNNDYIQFDDFKVWVNCANPGTIANKAPTINLTSPLNNSNITLGQAVSLSANAFDSDGTIKQVNFQINGNNHAQDITSPYTAMWNPTVPGTYQIKARAIDNDGASTESNVTVIVKARQNPQVTITNPPNGTSYNKGSSLEVRLSASDSDGSIVKYQLYINGSLVDTDANAYTSYTMSNLQTGTYTIRAVVTDNHGLTGQATSNITVKDIQRDCAGVVNGTAKIDACGICSGGTTGISPSAPKTWYADADGDGMGDPKQTQQSCNRPLGYVATAGDSCPADKNKTSPGTCGCGVPEGSCNEAPTVNITSPANGSIHNFGSTLSVQLNANDLDGSIMKHQIYIDGSLASTSGSNYTPYVMNNLQAGIYTIRAVVTDNGGKTGAQSITITVKERIVVNQDTIIGDNCASKNGTASFELSPEFRSNAKSYSWWFAGSSSSITSPPNESYKATIKFNEYYGGGKVCVGVSLNAAPYYKSYCKNISICPSITAQKSQAADAEVYPNPSQERVISVEVTPGSGSILEVRIMDSAGNIKYKAGAIENGASLDLSAFGHGTYYIHIICENGVVIKQLMLL